jgi:hypothetical protein
MRDEAWTLAQAVVASMADVQAVIAKGQNDFDGPDFLRDESKKKPLVEVLLDMDGQKEVDANDAIWSRDIIARFTATGDFERAKAFLRFAIRKANWTLKASPGELAKQIAGDANDDKLNAQRTAAMQIQAFFAAMKERERPAWLAKAKAALDLTSNLRRALIGEDVQFLKTVDVDKGFSVARFMDPTTIDPNFHVRRLQLPVAIPGWTKIEAVDHSSGAPRGAVVRQSPIPAYLYGMNSRGQ